MTTYLLSQIRNFKDCRVCYQTSLEMEAVVDAVMSQWDSLDVQMTADRGVSVEDAEIITEIIEGEGLDCTADECEAALLRECEERTGRAA